VIVMFAFGTAAPVASWTVPLILPETACEKAIEVAMNVIRATVIAAFIFLNIWIRPLMLIE
jgi:hypothetical protein